MKDFIIPILSALVATFGFTLFYNIRGKNVIIGSLCGAFSWAVYLIFQRYTNTDVMPYLIAGMGISLYSELAAYFFKTPATVYLIPGIIPLVPGLTVFRAMQACLLGELSLFAEGLVTTVKIGGAITLGLIFMSSVFRLFRSGISVAKTKHMQ